MPTITNRKSATLAKSVWVIARAYNRFGECIHENKIECESKSELLGLLAQLAWPDCRNGDPHWRVVRTTFDLALPY